MRHAAGHVKLNIDLFFSFLLVQTSGALAIAAVFIFPPQFFARLERAA
jgi:hypothetical protein